LETFLTQDTLGAFNPLLRRLARLHEIKAGFLFRSPQLSASCENWSVPNRAQIAFGLCSLLNRARNALGRYKAKRFVLFWAQDALGPFTSPLSKALGCCQALRISERVSHSFSFSELEEGYRGQSLATAFV
jgi:hypothetical protein